jgi:NADP-dependent 3-hydroxy acid dehydrogenase YdfG
MPTNPKPLSEQVIVLTGASSTIGLCTAQLAALCGARLVLLARSPRVLDALTGVIQSWGGEAMFLTTDITVREQVFAAAQSAVARFGRIDTWINNAGVCIYGRLDQVSEADSRHLFDVNFWGVVNGSLVALPQLSAGGSLINVGSEVPETAVHLQGMYASSKNAVRGFTEALRLEIEVIGRAPVSIRMIEPAAFGTTPAVDPMLVGEAILRAASCDNDQQGQAASLQVLSVAARQARQLAPAAAGP